MWTCCLSKHEHQAITAPRFFFFFTLCRIARNAILTYHTIVLKHCSNPQKRETTHKWTKNLFIYFFFFFFFYMPYQSTYTKRRQLHTVYYCIYCKVMKLHRCVFDGTCCKHHYVFFLFWKTAVSKISSDISRWIVETTHNAYLMFPIQTHKCIVWKTSWLQKQ